MFELLRLLGSDGVELALSTRLSRPVGNTQAPSTITEEQRQKYQRLLEKHPLWVERKAACGVYNCSGHVWGARRTAIYEQSEINKILQDDGYRPLRNAEPLSLSDLILYYERETFYHVGVVAKFQALSFGAEAGQPIPWILSKWNDTSGEVLHHFENVPFGDIPTQSQFWTDRP
jgi:hypothetical protein